MSTSSEASVGYPSERVYYQLIPNKLPPTPINGNHWTEKNLFFQDKFITADCFPTRFANRDILVQMGIVHNVEELLHQISMPKLLDMQYKTYPLQTKQLISTVGLCKNSDGDAILTFVVGLQRFNLSVNMFCIIYGLDCPRYNEPIPIFAKEHEVWRNITTNEPFVEHESRLSKVKNSTVRYTLQQLANTFFAREKVTTTTNEELSLLYQGIFRAMKVDEGEELEYIRGEVAYYFIEELINLKYKWSLGSKPKIFIGGVLTPLFEYIGIDLSDKQPFKPLLMRPSMDFEYLLEKKSLIGRRWYPSTFEHLFYHTNDNPRVSYLPQPYFTHTRTNETLSFKMRREGPTLQNLLTMSAPRSTKLQLT